MKSLTLDSLGKNLDKQSIFAAIGIFISIGAVSLLADTMHNQLLLAPFGATSIIAFLTPGAKYATPKNIICSYIVTAIIGVAVAYFMGHIWWTYAFGVGLALIVKKMFDVVHPPSAAIPIILIRAQEGTAFSLALDSVLPGLLILVGIAIIYNRYILKNDYPLWN
ncbi:HPP family protein [Selenomonadales bacterium OttesenSCG-928-I06]|nr:HPP family protein [Selenomonadales bacterium OttesenSCG-928-I06]